MGDRSIEIYRIAAAICCTAGACIAGHKRDTNSVSIGGRYMSPCQDNYIETDTSIAARLVLLDALSRDKLSTSLNSVFALNKPVY